MNGVTLAPDGVDVASVLKGLRLPVSLLEELHVTYVRRPKGDQWHVDASCTRLAGVAQSNLVNESFTLLKFVSSHRNVCPSCGSNRSYAARQRFGIINLAYWESVAPLVRYAATVSRLTPLVDSGADVAVEHALELDHVLKDLATLVYHHRLTTVEIEGERLSDMVQSAADRLTAEVRDILKSFRGRVLDPELDASVALTASIIALQMAVEETVHSRTYGMQAWSLSEPENLVWPADSVWPAGVVWPDRWEEEAVGMLHYRMSYPNLPELADFSSAPLDLFGSHLLSRLKQPKMWDEVPPVATLDKEQFKSAVEWASAEYESAVRCYGDVIVERARRVLHDAEGDQVKRLTLVHADHFRGLAVPSELTERLVASRKVASRSSDWVVCELSPLEFWLLERDKPSWVRQSHTVVEPVPNVSDVADVFFDLVEAHDSSDASPAELWSVANAIHQ